MKSLSHISTLRRGMSWRRVICTLQERGFYLQPAGPAWFSFHKCWYPYLNSDALAKFRNDLNLANYYRRPQREKLSSGENCAQVNSDEQFVKDKYLCTDRAFQEVCSPHSFWLWLYKNTCTRSEIRVHIAYTREYGVSKLSLSFSFKLYGIWALLSTC